MIQNLAAVMTVAASFVATGPVRWQDDYGKALAATKSDQRPLLVVLDIPSDPKTSFDSTLLDNQGAAGELLRSFHVCRVDASTEYGRRVAQAFHATTFPHTTIIDKTGAIVLYKKPGQFADGEWRDVLAKYSSGDQPMSHTAFYRGDLVSGTVQGQSQMGGSSYCPSCQRKAMNWSF